MYFRSCPRAHFGYNNCSYGSCYHGNQGLFLPVLPQKAIYKINVYFPLSANTLNGPKLFGRNMIITEAYPYTQFE